MTPSDWPSNISRPPSVTGSTTTSQFSQGHSHSDSSTLDTEVCGAPTSVTTPDDKNQVDGAHLGASGELVNFQGRSGIEENHARIQMQSDPTRDATSDQGAHRPPMSSIIRERAVLQLLSEESNYVRSLDDIRSYITIVLEEENTFSMVPSDRYGYPTQIISNILQLRTCSRRFLQIISNILQLRTCSRRLLDARYTGTQDRIDDVGIVLASALADIDVAYTTFIQSLPAVIERARCVEHDTYSSELLERYVDPESVYSNLEHLLIQPCKQLDKYFAALAVSLNSVADDTSRAHNLSQAIKRVEKLRTAARIYLFQLSRGRRSWGRLEWHDLVSDNLRISLQKQEVRRQSIIFEVIATEMNYVNDLESLNTIYVAPLRVADPSIIPSERLSQFVQTVFSNFTELYVHHSKMLSNFHEIQRAEHPMISSIAKAMYDAVPHFREAYLVYIPNYPISEYILDQELATNAEFRLFHEACIRHPNARKLHMKHTINRPIPRLFRYQLLLQSLLRETPEGHEDREVIPKALDAYQALWREVEAGALASKRKVEMWQYVANIVFGQYETHGLDLSNEDRSLIHSDVVFLRHNSSSILGQTAFKRLVVLLFDHYLIMTEPTEKGGIMQNYLVYQRPIPVDLITFTTLFRFGRSETDGRSFLPTDNSLSAGKSSLVYIGTVGHRGKPDVSYPLFTQSAEARDEWKQHLKGTINAKTFFQTKVLFPVVDSTSSRDPNKGDAATLYDGAYYAVGNVSCSAKFTTPDGRTMVAVGGPRGLYLRGLDDANAKYHVLQLQAVTQCAVLEDDGLLLVLADKALFAYEIDKLAIEAPSSRMAHAYVSTQQPVRGERAVQFFNVGTLDGRTFVVYAVLKRGGTLVVALQPNAVRKARLPDVPRVQRLNVTGVYQTQELFELYKQFTIPSEALDLMFLRDVIVVPYSKGFQLVDLSPLRKVRIPTRDAPEGTIARDSQVYNDQRLQKVYARCETCRPLGMFHTNEDRFLLCYDVFGIYIDSRGRVHLGSPMIEWEGTVERATLHAPYLLLFTPQFIEVRHVDTGNLMQIILGNDIRCLWDGRSQKRVTTSSIPGPEGWHESPSQGAIVHVAMEVDEPPQSDKERPMSRIYELSPVIPLYLPKFAPILNADIRSAMKGWS